MNWTAIFSLYLVIGVLFVFVGPAADGRRRETGKARLDATKAWRPAALSAVLALAIIFLWPVLVSSAWRSMQGQRRFPPKGTWQKPPLSAAAHERIEQARRAGPRVLTFEEFGSIGDGLDWDGRAALFDEMDRIGCTVDGATTEHGRQIPVALGAMREIGSPILLTKPQSALEGSAPPEEASVFDEVWHFSNDSDYWEHLAGRAGTAFVKDGTVVRLDVEIMN